MKIPDRVTVIPNTHGVQLVNFFLVDEPGQPERMSYKIVPILAWRVMYSLEDDHHEVTPITLELQLEDWCYKVSENFFVFPEDRWFESVDEALRSVEALRQTAARHLAAARVQH